MIFSLPFLVSVFSITICQLHKDSVLLPILQPSFSCLVVTYICLFELILRNRFTQLTHQKFFQYYWNKTALPSELYEVFHMKSPSLAIHNRKLRIFRKYNMSRQNHYITKVLIFNKLFTCIIHNRFKGHEPPNQNIPAHSLNSSQARAPNLRSSFCFH